MARPSERPARRPSARRQSSATGLAPSGTSIQRTRAKSPANHHGFLDSLARTRNLEERFGIKLLDRLTSPYPSGGTGLIRP